MNRLVPLAARMRPTTIDEFVGQPQAVGVLRPMLHSGTPRNLLLWGPPGSGKTTIAALLGESASLPMERLSAVSSGVADVRKVLAKATESGCLLLFIDEIHRFNRGQQDALLQAAEDGTIVLVGATTENPFFEVNSPLLSRMLLVQLQSLDSDALTSIISKALSTDEALTGVTVEPEALSWLTQRSGGDARVALTTLEVAAADGGTVTLEAVQAAMGQRAVRYDKSRDAHYDVISAFIKSMRGSDPDAAMYWLEVMIIGGEDPRFIARRMVIFASEDVGMVDPMALVVAEAAASALDRVGLPEAEYNLSQAAIYLASTKKSNAIGRAMQAARKDAERFGADVPLHLRSAGHPGVRGVGHGVGYKYPPSDPEAAKAQRYRPSEAEGKRYFMLEDFPAKDDSERPAP